MNRNEVFEGFTFDDIFGDSLNLKLDQENGIEEEVIEESPKLVKVLPDGIQVLDKELLDKINNKNLSASMVSSFFQCPADWLMNSFILPLVDHEEPIYFARGKMFHDTMENFFNFPKEERSPKLLSQTAMQVVKTKYPSYLEDKETMNWMRTALKGYLDTGFNYANVDVAQISKYPGKAPEIGTELFVKGKIGNTKRQVVGFIDRLDQLPNGSLQIVDYKTGGKIQPFDPQQPIGDGNDFSYWRQQLAYAHLLEKDGHYIGGAKLEFPIAGGEVIVDVANEYMKEQTIKDFELLDASLTKSVEENFFPFAGHFFCKWCGMLSPNFTPSRFGNLKVSWEDVTQHVEM